MRFSEHLPAGMQIEREALYKQQKIYKSNFQNKQTDKYMH
jgi:hypothetical protein